MIDYKKRQQEYSSDLKIDVVPSEAPVVGHYGSFSNNTDYTTSVMDGKLANVATTASNSTTPQGYQVPLPSRVQNLNQDFSEADSEVSIESMYPEMYKLFHKKIQELSPYVGLAENPYDYNDEVQRMGLFGKLSYAMRKASEGLAWAYVQQKMAYARRKEAEAIAAIDDFPQYLSDQADQGRTIKPTDATREAYVKMNPRVIKAYQREAFCEAMVEQLNVLKYGFSEGSKTLRAMCYGQKDSNNLSSLSNTRE